MSYKVLLLGDYHLRKVSSNFDTKDANQLINFNLKWVCSQWANIKFAKKEYFKYKNDNGVPDIVILSVGNNDLTKVSSLHCVLTSLLRIANMMHKDGVICIMICTLVEHEFSIGSYNSQINKINNVLQSKASKIPWLFVLTLLNKSLYTADDIYESNGRYLKSKVIDRISEDLKCELNSEEFKDYLLKEKDNSKTLQVHSNKEASRNAQKTKFSKESKAVFHNEMRILKLKLNLMLKEKSHTDEKSTKLDNNIVAMTQYLSKLEALASK